jgi:hypothetical protein
LPSPCDLAAMPPRWHFSYEMSGSFLNVAAK